MISKRLLSTIVHVCMDTPRTSLENACELLEQGGAAVERLKELTGILSKQALVSLSRSLQNTEMSARGLALALRSTVAGIESGRNTPNVQLVWTGPDMPSNSPRDTLPQMLELIGRAKEKILLVTFAAFKAHHIMGALEDAFGRGVSIMIIVESSEDSAGQLTVSSSKAFPISLIQAGCLWFWPNKVRPRNSKGLPGKLHAKCLVIDDREALISSANLTDDAMQRNIEVGVRCSSGPIAAEIASKFASLIAAGTLKRVMPPNG